MAEVGKFHRFSPSRCFPLDLPPPPVWAATACPAVCQAPRQAKPIFELFLFHQVQVCQGRGAIKPAVLTYYEIIHVRIDSLHINQTTTENHNNPRTAGPVYVSVTLLAGLRP